MSTIAANYRSFRLPWTPSAAEERLFRRIAGATIGLFIAFGIVIPLLPQPPVIQPSVGETKWTRLSLRPEGLVWRCQVAPASVVRAM